MFRCASFLFFDDFALKIMFLRTGCFLGLKKTTTLITSSQIRDAAQRAEQQESSGKTGGQTEAGAELERIPSLLLTCVTLQNETRAPLMYSIRQRARRKPSGLSHHFHLFRAPSTIHGPYMRFVYQCPNCPEWRERKGACGVSWRALSSLTYKREERMIAILPLLSRMYQLNHSSILPQSSPGLGGRH